MKSFEDVIRLADAVADEMDAAVFVYSGGIDERGHAMMLRSLQENPKKRKNAVLVLTTGGGSANAAYKIAKRLQSGFDDFSVFVPAYCKSAGTLVTLGAKRIFMSDGAELGPLDVQQLQRDEIGRRKSGLVVRTAFEGLASETKDLFEKLMIGIKVSSGGTVSFETAARIATHLTTGVMAPIYAQISPETLGSDLRDLNIASNYGEMLSAIGNNVKSGGIAKLVGQYPSHDFVIDRAEAETIFETVCKPSASMIEFEDALGRVIYTPQEPHFVFRIDSGADRGEHDKTLDVAEEAANEPGAPLDEDGSSSG